MKNLKCKNSLELTTLSGNNIKINIEIENADEKTTIKYKLEREHAY